MNTILFFIRENTNAMYLTKTRLSYIMTDKFYLSLSSGYLYDLYWIHRHLNKKYKDNTSNINKRFITMNILLYSQNWRFSTISTTNNIHYSFDKKIIFMCLVISWLVSNIYRALRSKKSPPTLPWMNFKSRKKLIPKNI